MTALSPMPSCSSRAVKNPLHSRLPSSEYLPVPRHTSGSQQSRHLLEASTLSDKTLNGEGREWPSPQGSMKKRPKTLLSGISPLNWVCYVLHALLIILHTVLLGMLLTGIDHRIPIPPAKANFYSVLLTVIQQMFFTVYQGALVVITQQLTLRSNLLRRQTLTALHDKSVAWGGLGASILSLWRQVSVPAAVHGTFCVVLYLVSISILHVSSSSLISVETYNTNVSSIVGTILGLPNMTAVEGVYDSESWDNAGAIASTFWQLPVAHNYGFANSTVYDILVDTTGVGTTTVNATTFTAKCYCAEQVVNISSSDPSDVTIEWGDLNASIGTIPLYEGTLWFAGSLPGEVEGRLLTFLSSPPIPDSNGALGTTFPVVGTINGVLEEGANLTQGVQVVNITNPTVESQIQAITCSLSYTTQHAIINSQTNALISVSPRADDPPVVWSPTMNLTSTDWDPVVEWFSSAWFHSSSTETEMSPSITCGLIECRMSFLNLRLLSMLGLEINTYSYIRDGQNGNITSPEKSNATLSDLEEMLSVIAAQLVWTLGHITTNVSNSASNFIQLAGEAEVLKTVLSSRLSLNLVPVTVGLGMSVVLFVLAYILTGDAAHAQDTFTPDNMGILQLLWLFSRQPGVRESLYEVSEPLEDQLRKAGLVDVQAIDDNGR
ncbi:hypothetical protein BDN67DRAFT_967684 [Paxillus ammoniavirescens]|nr:hypothetical protein BDN67DRAFT_967684 [Paxillus ammoniavirescens]